MKPRFGCSPKGTITWVALRLFTTLFMAIRAIRRQSLPTNWIPKEWLIAVFLPKQVLERANSEEDLPKASLETIQKSNMQSFKGKQFLISIFRIHLSASEWRSCYSNSVTLQDANRNSYYWDDFQFGIAWWKFAQAKELIPSIGFYPSVTGHSVNCTVRQVNRQA